MQTPVVIRAIGFVLLTAVICGFAWNTSLAGGPQLWWTANVGTAANEVPFAFTPRYTGTQRTFDAPALALPFDEAPAMPRTGLIPTQWEANYRLIPTEIEAQTFSVQPYSFHSIRTSPPERIATYWNRQGQILTGVTPRAAGPRVTSSSRVATVPQSPSRWRPEAMQLSKEAGPQRK